MPGKANRNLATCMDDGDALVFSWVRRHPGVFWLWGFLVLSLLLHATGFYLFQVVYPSSGRLEPFPAQVLILDKKNAANSVLLQELDDRLVFLQPASTASDSRKSIEDFTVSFQPSFAARTPPFREPVVPDASPEPSNTPSLPPKPSAPQPSGIGTKAQVPPPPAASASPPPERVTAYPRRWSIAGDLSKRAMSATQAQSLDDALTSIGEGPEMLFDIVISASGEVMETAVKSGVGHPAADKFVSAVKKQLKFDPIAGNHSTQGELRIH